MTINYGRIQRAQALMRENGLTALMIMNQDDYRYFFGFLRVQPRAIIPAVGQPIFIIFRGEEWELREEIGDETVKVSSHVGEQISNVRETFQALFGGPPPGMVPPKDGKPRVGMQMWFHTPAFLVDLFRRVNPQIELVSSDPVMDALRMVKEPAEIELMRRAQKIASLGMDKARELLRPGVTGHEMAAEILYVMMKAGAEGTSTPIYVNAGAHSSWTHGTVEKLPIRNGDLVVIDLTPQYEGYCSNLARTFVVGAPNAEQSRLVNTYLEMREVARRALKPGITVGALDDMCAKVCERWGLAEHHLNGIAHGIGLRFEETPASTIIPQHRKVSLRENMTVTVGHTVLALPRVGGVRFEDVYRVTSEGGEILFHYPVDFEVTFAQ